MCSLNSSHLCTAFTCHDIVAANFLAPQIAVQSCIWRTAPIVLLLCSGDARQHLDSGQHLTLTHLQHATRQSNTTHHAVCWHTHCKQQRTTTAAPSCRQGMKTHCMEEEEHTTGCCTAAAQLLLSQHHAAASCCHGPAAAGNTSKAGISKPRADAQHCCHNFCD